MLNDNLLPRPFNLVTLALGFGIVPAGFHFSVATNRVDTALINDVESNFQNIFRIEKTNKELSDPFRPGKVTHREWRNGRLAEWTSSKGNKWRRGLYEGGQAAAAGHRVWGNIKQQTMLATKVLQYQHGNQLLDVRPLTTGTLTRENNNVDTWATCSMAIFNNVIHSIGTMATTRWSTSWPKNISLRHHLAQYIFHILH